MNYNSSILEAMVAWRQRMRPMSEKLKVRCSSSATNSQRRRLADGESLNGQCGPTSRLRAIE